MSAWKELQLAMADDSVSEEDLQEYQETWEMECREDEEIDRC